MAAANEAQRDLDLLQHIRRYCNDAIDAAHQANTESAFMEGRLYQHAIAMWYWKLENYPNTYPILSFEIILKYRGARSAE